MGGTVTYSGSHPCTEGKEPDPHINRTVMGRQGPLNEDSPRIVRIEKSDSIQWYTSYI